MMATAASFRKIRVMSSHGHFQLIKLCQSFSVAQFWIGIVMNRMNEMNGNVCSLLLSLFLSIAMGWLFIFERCWSLFVIRNWEETKVCLLIKSVLSGRLFGCWVTAGADDRQHASKKHSVIVCICVIAPLVSSPPPPPPSRKIYKDLHITSQFGASHSTPLPSLPPSPLPPSSLKDSMPAGKRPSLKRVQS